MKIKRVALSFFMAVFALLATASVALAQTPIFAQTLVVGFVYDSSSLPVSSGTVTITCGSATQTVSIAADGSYQAFFQQTACSTGDTASANALTAEGSGSNSTTVTDTVVNGPEVNLDIAIMNININVPELGMISGIMTAVGAVGSFFYLRGKSIV